MAQFPGMFVPTTPVFDVQSLQGKDLSSSEFIQFMVALTQRINLISIQLNAKDIGLYQLTEILNGQQFFPNPALSSTTAQSPTQRPVLRTVVNFGALPNAATKSVPHGITFDATTSFTRIYGTATFPSTSAIPIPYSSTVNINQNISIVIDATNVNITTAMDYTNFTICYVILEYIKQ
jgi:hypothetical protein